jgi:hypothetical protein
MFGRKKIQPTRLRFASDPRPSHNGPDRDLDRRVDSAIAALSEALGLDLEFGTAYIFAPSLWHNARVGDMIRNVGIVPNMVGNTVQLLRSPASVAKVNAMPPDHQIRALLKQAGFGITLHDPHAENGYASGMIGMQAKVLSGFLDKGYSEEALHYAVLDLHKWSRDVISGEIEISPS